MSTPISPDLLVSGLRAAGWTIHGPTWRGHYTASTKLCHDGDTDGKNPHGCVIKPSNTGGFIAGCFSRGCGQGGTQGELGKRLLALAGIERDWHPVDYRADDHTPFLAAVYRHSDGTLRREYRRQWPSEWPDDQERCPYKSAGRKEPCGLPRTESHPHRWTSGGGQVGVLARVVIQDPQRPVIVAEGAKAANALIAGGYNAANWFGGAGAVRRADLSPLHGRPLILWPDNDKTGLGEWSMRWLAYRLREKCPDISIVPPYYTGGDKSDAADCPAGELAAHIAKAAGYRVDQQPPDAAPRPSRPPAGSPTIPAAPTNNGHAANGEFQDFHDIGKWYGEKHLGNRWTYDPGLGAWFRYNGKVWEELGSHQLCSITDRISDTRWGLAQELKDAGQLYAAALLAEAREWRYARGGGGDFWSGLRTSRAGELPITELHLIATPGGVVDLRHGKIYNHDPRFGIRAIAAGHYRPEDYDRLRALLRRRMEQVFDDTNFDALCGYIGMTLTGRAQRRKGLVLIIGKSGSGKSGTINLVKDALGDYAFAASRWLEKQPRGDVDATLADVLEKRPRMIVCEEVGTGSAVNVNRLLRLTGASEDVARRPYGTLRRGELISAIWSSAVTPPNWRTNDGIKRRLGLLNSRAKLPEAAVDDSGEYQQELLDAVITVGVIEAAAVYRPDYRPPEGDARAFAETLAEMDDLMGLIENLPDEWSGRQVSELLEFAKAELDRDITPHILGIKIRGSERWVKESPNGGRHRKKAVIRLANPSLLPEEDGNAGDAGVSIAKVFDSARTVRSFTIETPASPAFPSSGVGDDDRWCGGCAVYYYEEECPHCAVEVEVGDEG